MNIKYRAIIDNEVYYFDLKWLSIMASIDTSREYDYQKIMAWLHGGNQPDAFTGLRDINGVDIYENSIVNHPSRMNEFYNYPLLVVFDEGSFGINEGGWFRSFNFLSGEFGIDITTWEIIGNIHQNKELLTNEI